MGAFLPALRDSLSAWEMPDIRIDRVSVYPSHRPSLTSSGLAVLDISWSPPHYLFTHVHPLRTSVLLCPRVATSGLFRVETPGRGPTGEVLSCD